LLHFVAFSRRLISYSLSRFVYFVAIAQLHLHLRSRFILHTSVRSRLPLFEMSNAHEHE
jgi:hypothetical protein